MKVSSVDCTVRHICTIQTKPVRLATVMRDLYFKCKGTNNLTFVLDFSKSLFSAANTCILTANSCLNYV